MCALPWGERRRVMLVRIAFSGSPRISFWREAAKVRSSFHRLICNAIRNPARFRVTFHLVASPGRGFLVGKSDSSERSEEIRHPLIFS
jgi:hypothetical protein